LKLLGGKVGVEGEREDWPADGVGSIILKAAAAGCQSTLI